MEEFDAIIIGSGQGGNPLAHKLADDGWRVALVERSHLGGSCVNEGCTPTKTMIASARAAYEVRRASGLGIHVAGVDVRMDEVVARKNQMVDDWRSGQQAAVDERDTLEVVRGHGRFLAPKTIEVSGRTLRGEFVVINTGTRPRSPAIEGIDDVPTFTNRTIMDVRSVPEHLVVVGAGYVGLEFAQMYRRFGSEVTVLQASDQIVPKEDADVAEALRLILQDEGIRIETGVEVQSLTHAGTEVRIEARDLDIRPASHVLIAAGRVPNTEDLGLDKAGIELDKEGFIPVDAHLRTSAKNVWAIGDVTGGPAFTHISYDDHLIVYGELRGNVDRRTSDRLVPYALYTDPELGRVGLTEKAARDKGYGLKIGKVSMDSVARAKETGRTEGLMKVVIDASNDQILGAAMLADHGGELVQVIMAAMMGGLPWTRLKRAVYIHPTLVEGFFGLFERVENV